MSLNIGGTGIVKPYARYHARTGTWSLRGLDGSETTIDRPTFAADFKNICTGWFRYREGLAPERVTDPSLDDPAAFPGEGFKRGFVVLAFSPKFFRGVAEVSGASMHLHGQLAPGGQPAWAIARRARCRPRGQRAGRRVA